VFTDADTGYVRGSISGEVIELLPSGLKGTGQEFDHKGVIFCVSHFQDIPKHIAENLNSNAANRKGKA
jgi:hypothetical protein